MYTNIKYTSISCNLETYCCLYSCSVDIYGGNATISVNIGEEPQQKVLLLICLDTLHIAHCITKSRDKPSKNATNLWSMVLTIQLLLKSCTKCDTEESTCRVDTVP